MSSLATGCENLDVIDFVLIFKLLRQRRERVSGKSIVRALGTPSLTRAAPSEQKFPQLTRFEKTQLRVTHLTQTLQRHLISEYNLVCEVLTFPYLCPISVLSLTTLPSSTASSDLPLSLGLFSHSSHGSLHFLQVTS